jgi:glycosyltransferase involved in cell wall biosynthesis
VKRRLGRLGRMLTAMIDVAVVGFRRKAFIYHFHDPELLPAGLLLRALGRKVVYDAHEDLPRCILIREWIPRRLRRPISLGAAAVEWIAGHVLSGVVAATPVIANRFPRRSVALVQNFASTSEFVIGDDEIARQDRRAVGFIGNLTIARCAVEMVEAIARVEQFPDAKLLIAGKPQPPSLFERLAAMPGWTRVDYRGWLDRTGIRHLLAEVRASLVLYHPLQCHIDCQPVKLFEYMAAGIPVIAADFPRFRDIVERNRCGLCVPPQDVQAIASAVEWIFEHPAEAEQMGKRGRELMMNTFNWEHEESELLSLYERIGGRV